MVREAGNIVLTFVIIFNCFIVEFSQTKIKYFAAEVTFD